ncbi:MAG TPA: DUF1287 domain-containing protein [Cyclobacteriaceae bacterium]|nr:DUF1287 domain-containing protein [Cyclobacteriaceae bacterium]HRJ83167.1 DUF1287 domain-containing protein [Cyclobacteriaceae bacterium]
MRFACLFIGSVLITSANKAQDNFSNRLSAAALELTKATVQYDGAYYSMPYPGGDVPADRGVCTDVIIRAYRKLGIDLQVEVHRDMLAHFNHYPKTWGLTKPDKNIDHRRVPNLMTYFSRHGLVKKISTHPSDYLPGDIVAWNLGGNLTHIGIVINQKSDDGFRNLIVHNIGNGQEISDCLFTYKIIGHYSYPKP